MLAQVYAVALSGINAIPVKVEVDVQMKGLPGWNMVGLLETAVKESRERVATAAKNLNLSGRSIHRVLKVARTIADLADSEEISSPHIAEALQFRPTTNEIF